MNINIQDLPQEIKNILPFSIRLETNPVNISDLPFNVQQLLIESNITEEINAKYKPKVIYDVDFLNSLYNDLYIYNTKKETLIQYIKNYLMTPKGTYPFDPEFGNELKKHLQTKDSSLRYMLLENELKTFVNVINNSFNIGLSIISSTVNKAEQFDHTVYSLEIKFSLNEETISFTVT